MPTPHFKVTLTVDAPHLGDIIAAAKLMQGTKVDNVDLILNKPPAEAKPAPAPVTTPAKRTRKKPAMRPPSGRSCIDYVSAWMRTIPFDKVYDWHEGRSHTLKAGYSKNGYDNAMRTLVTRGVITRHRDGSWERVRPDNAGDNAVKIASRFSPLLHQDQEDSAA